jgi:hypothetical protein
MPSPSALPPLPPPTPSSAPPAAGQLSVAIAAMAAVSSQPASHLLAIGGLPASSSALHAA